MPAFVGLQGANWGGPAAHSAEMCVLVDDVGEGMREARREGGAAMCELREGARQAVRVLAVRQHCVLESGPDFIVVGDSVRVDVRDGIRVAPCSHARAQQPWPRIGSGHREGGAFLLCVQ